MNLENALVHALGGCLGSEMPWGVHVVGPRYALGKELDECPGLYP
jgi:hypothetical protein